MDEASIFREALNKSSPTERAAFLQEACRGNDEERRSVELLLKAHDKAGGFLAESRSPVSSTTDEPLRKSPGDVIGPYKLIELIGEGGMGAVWMAQQSEPVKRLVALKLIKAGMDSKQIIARFEAERQALALMDHPNIAKVFDGGTVSHQPDASAGRTASPLAYASGGGRPYFVMELVKGVPITRCCDEHRLTPRQRLELFITVCHAIQHAHPKGIIHRDLKPSNVLVAIYDGNGRGGFSVSCTTRLPVRLAERSGGPGELPFPYLPVTVGDLNGDRKTDVVATTCPYPERGNAWSSPVYILHGVGNGSLQPPRRSVQGSTWRWAISMAMVASTLSPAALSI